MSFLLLDDFTVPGYDLRVSLAHQFKDEDASGETSSTSKAKKGTKGKRLECKIFIRFKDEADLRELTRAAEQTSGGDNKVYSITNRTANAAGMRQGRFSGDFKADEQDGLRCWLVSFTLAEHISVPERAESRETPKSAEAQQNEGETVAPKAKEEKQELSWFERKLKTVSDALGDYDGGKK